MAIRSGDPEVSGTTVIEAAEQLTVTPGAAPPERPVRLDPDQLSELGGCLVDFHAAALDRDIDDHHQRVAERIAAPDIVPHGDGGSLPLLTGGGHDAEGPPPAPGESIAGQDDVCVVTDCDPSLGSGQPEDPQPPVRELQVPVFDLE